MMERKGNCIGKGGGCHTTESDLTPRVLIHIKHFPGFLNLFVMSRAFMADSASQGGDADTSRAPGLAPGFEGP